MSSSLLNLDDVEEFTRVAGLGLDSAQAAELQEALRLLPETGCWAQPTWTVRHSCPDMIAARALIGLLVLDEDIIWSIPQRVTLTDKFHRLVDIVGQMGSPDVKVRHANGEEGFERLDTGTRLRLMCRHIPGAARGYSCDLLIVDGSAGLTNRQRNDLLPTLATRPNPQIVYA